MGLFFEWIIFHLIGFFVAWYAAAWITRSLRNQSFLRSALRIVWMMLFLVLWRADILIATRIAQAWCHDPALPEMVKVDKPLEDYPVGRSVGGICETICQKALYDVGIKRVYIHAIKEGDAYVKEGSDLWLYELQACDTDPRGYCPVGVVVSEDDHPWEHKESKTHSRTFFWDEVLSQTHFIDKNTNQMVSVTRGAIVDIEWTAGLWKFIGDYPFFGRATCSSGFFTTFPALNTQKQENTP